MHAAWLIAEPEPYEEYDLGPLKTGKEADVFLVERVAPDGRSCLLAHKRYRPRAVRHKGDLEALGFQRAASFVHDRAYRDGRALSKSRDRRAAAKGTAWGRTVLRAGWSDNEFDMLQRLAGAGVTVPLPVERTGDGVLMQYLGDRERAAPRLVHAGLDRAGLVRAAGLLVDDLRRMVAAGIVHADLSVFNLLWWDARLWVIDVPQAVEVGTNLQAFDLLHRDVTNVATWFRARGVPFDADEVFAELVAL
jgi:RIO kinase 1